MVPPAPPPIARLPLFLVVAGAVVVVVLLWPLLPAIVLALVLATLAGPAHQRIRARIHNRSLAAFASTAGVVLLFLIPFSLLVLLVGREAARGIEWLTSAGSLGTGNAAFEGAIASALDRLGFDSAALSGVVIAQLQRLGGALAARTVSFVTGIGGGLLQGGAALFALYFMLRDSDRMHAGFRRVIPIDPVHTVLLMARAQEVTHAIVYGNLLVAATQGVMGAVAFWIVGLPSPTLWGTMMGMLALIPMVGPPFVYIPASIFLLLTGEVGRGLLLAAMGGLVISSVDNLLRAIFVGERAEIHPLIVFFGVLGGFFVFGAAGIVLGPVLFVLALTWMESARTAMEPPPLIIAATTLPPEEA